MGKSMFNFLVSCLLVVTFGTVQGTPITSCSQTPYPEVCNQFNSNDLQATVKETAVVFVDIALQVTLDVTVQVKKFVLDKDLSSSNERTKLASADCLEHLKDLVNQLNHTISSRNYLNDQTWLNSAISNQNKCQNSLGSCSGSHMLSDLSKLLANLRAVLNKAAASSSYILMGRQRKSKEANIGFPSWVSSADRRFLLSKKHKDGKGHIVVAKDGSAHYKTIREALRAVKERSKEHNRRRFVIHVKKGIYKETVVIPKNLPNLILIGDGINVTVITGNRKVRTKGDHTYKTATVSVEGNGFVAKNITFRNEASGSQAVALHSIADKSIFYKCGFEGYQDTLYVHSNRQFYRNCDIYGTTDFIFGGAKAVFQQCNIYVRKLGNHGENFIVAPGSVNDSSAIVIHNSHIKAAPELLPVQKKFRTYLARPWRDYSRVIYIKNEIDDLVDPQGWFTGKAGDTKGIEFLEYMNYGSGSDTSKRVKGESYKVVNNSQEVWKFSVGEFLDGTSWIPETKVPFMAEL